VFLELRMYRYGSAAEAWQQSGGPAWIRTRVSAPLEEILPRYAAAMKRALEAGDFDDVARMLDLLEALGGPS